MTSTWRAATQDETDRSDAEEDRPFGSFAPNFLQRMLIGIARGSVLKRGLFRKSVTHSVFLLGGNRPLDVTFRGCAYRLRHDRNLINYGILLKPDYNRRDIDFLVSDAPPAPVFVDLGCNIGLYTLPLAKAAGSTGRVVAVDANPMMARRVAWNAAASRLGNVLVHSCAVSDRDGAATLAIRKDDLAIAAIREDEAGEIPVRRLDALLRESGVDRIHGLKIDIEGHEDLALAPFLQEAPEALLPRRIVIEHPVPDADYPACTVAFAQRGYRLEGRTRNNSLYRLDR